MGLSIAKGLKGTYNIEVVGRNMNKLEAFEKALELKIDKYLLDDFDMTDKTILFCVKRPLDRLVRIRTRREQHTAVTLGQRLQEHRKPFAKSVNCSLQPVQEEPDLARTRLAGDIVGHDI